MGPTSRLLFWYCAMAVMHMFLVCIGFGMPPIIMLSLPRSGSNLIVVPVAEIDC